MGPHRVVNPKKIKVSETKLFFCLFFLWIINCKAGYYWPKFQFLLHKNISPRNLYQMILLSALYIKDNFWLLCHKCVIQNLMGLMTETSPTLKVSHNALFYTYTLQARPYPFIQILFWFYPDFIQILSRFYQYFIYISSKFYPDFILIFEKNLDKIRIKCG